MTGLSLDADALIEVAVLVTDSELNVLGDGVDVVIKPDPSTLEQMGDFVRQMHTTSGLLDELELHLVPVLLGGGSRLFEGVRPARLEQLRVVEAPGVAHLRYRVLR